MEVLSIFLQFTQNVSTQINCNQILESYQANYNLKKFKITEISTNSALQMFQHIVQKFYKNHNPGESGTWVENQLRLYIWTVICYIEVYRKQLSNFTLQDWNFFARIFYIKEFNLFQYQARILLDESVKMAKWTQQQDYMLYCIITKQKAAKWNQIAKTMFIRSNKQYLRASKQCRQRWFNHLDPTKSKSEWNLKQYLTLFEQVYQKGKKWALIVKSLRQRRSEHSIKNKYNSIVRKQLKLCPDETQVEACRQLINKMNRILENCIIQPNDDYLFGCSLKLYKNEFKGKKSIEQISKKQSKVNPANSELSRNRFEIFRKKIQKFQCGSSSTTQTTYRNEPEAKNKYVKKQPASKQAKFSQICNAPTSYQLKEIERSQQYYEQQDDIFYEDSFDANQILKPQHFGFFYNDDVKDVIDDHRLMQ